MNAKQLAQLFINYKEATDKVVALEEKIKAAVLELGESQKIAGVTATYYQQSVTTDYKTVCEDALAKELIDEDAVEEFTTHTKTVKWAEVVKKYALEIHSHLKTVNGARVVVKVK
jgi:hypothetical protein